MKFEDVLGVHVIFMCVILIVQVIASEARCVGDLSVISILLIYGVYVPSYIVYKLSKYLIKKINTK